MCEDQEVYKTESQKKYAEAYSPLSDLMYDQYGIILLTSEMDDIIRACETVKKNVDSL